MSKNIICTDLIASKVHTCTLRRQENNRIRMASMRSSERRHHGQYALCKCIGTPRVFTFSAFHF